MEELAVSAEAAPLPDFNVFGWPYAGFVTLAALALYMVLGILVGRARRKYNVPAPSMDGPPDFLRVLRAHLNTLEQLVPFLVLLWIAALSFRDEVAAVIGGVWVAGRVAYAIGYIKAASKRHIGFLISAVALIVLFIMAAVQLVRSALVWQ